MAGKVSDHLANERTFLAWVRTALGLIGLGFVLARMGLFLRQIAASANAESLAGLKLGHALHTGQEFIVTGLVFLVAGTATCGWAGRLYGRNRQAIDAERFESAFWPVIMLTVVVMLGGLVVIALVVGRVIAGG